MPALAISLLTLLTAPSASAERTSVTRFGAVPPLTADERAALVARDLVTRPLRFEEREGGSYVGGVSYQVVRADPASVLAAFADAQSLTRALPSTQSALMLSRDGRTARVELVQGRAPFLARYTVFLEQAGRGNTIRFWLDPTRPHDIADVWGYFRVEPFGEGRSLVTVAAALDLGPGLARVLFEDRVQRAILRTPSRIRAFVEPLALAAAR